MSLERRPIAVFDSGLGGLTAVRELRRRLEHEDIVYFGDTARVPYGTKTRETVTRFARQNCEFLMRFDPKCIIAACNTVSAVCLPDLAAEFAIPFFGVVEPGAAAAVKVAGPDDLIAVIATDATIHSNAYKNAIASLDPGRAVAQTSCPLFVPMVEEAMDERDPIVTMMIERYLGPLRRLQPQVVVLGCTHYPMLRDALGEFFGDQVCLIDSADSTADAVVESLRALEPLSLAQQRGTLHCYVSDNPKRFKIVGSRFLGESINDVVRVCPEELSGSRPMGSAVSSRASA